MDRAREAPQVGDVDVQRDVGDPALSFLQVGRDKIGGKAAGTWPIGVQPSAPCPPAEIAAIVARHLAPARRGPMGSTTATLGQQVDDRDRLVPGGTIFWGPGGKRQPQPPGVATWPRTGGGTFNAGNGGTAGQ